MKPNSENILFLGCVLGSLSQHTLSQANLNKHNTCDHMRAGRKPSGGGEILNGMQPQLVRGPGLRPLALAVDLYRQRSQNNELMGKNAARGGSLGS